MATRIIEFDTVDELIAYQDKQRRDLEMSAVPVPGPRPSPARFPKFSTLPKVSQKKTPVVKSRKKRTNAVWTPQENKELISFLTANSHEDGRLKRGTLNRAARKFRRSRNGVSTQWYLLKRDGRVRLE